MLDTPCEASGGFSGVATSGRLVWAGWRVTVVAHMHYDGTSAVQRCQVVFDMPDVRPRVDPCMGLALGRRLTAFRRPQAHRPGLAAVFILSAKGAAVLSELEAIHLLSDLATADGLPSKVDLGELDPMAFPPGELRLAVRRAIDGLSFRDQILPDLSNEARNLLLANDPEKPLYRYSTWADLGRVLGPLRWEWDNWLPSGMLTMIVAEQAAGKSILALRIAACYLRGDPWPDGAPFTGQTGAVLWCEAESSQGMNFDRAARWGLPVDMLRSPIEDPLDDLVLQDPEHLAAIRYFAGQPDVRLVIVDSLSGANTAKENDAAMVHVVKGLATIAKETGKPLILTHHLRKKGLLDNGDRVTLDRVRGATGITQTARVAWAIDAPDPKNEEKRRLSLIKNNPKGVRCAEPIGLTIGEDGVTFCDAPEAPRQETQQDKAADLMKALLRKGPRRATELQEECEGAGVSWDAAKRAKQRGGIVSFRKEGVWWWALEASEGVRE